MELLRDWGNQSVGNPYGRRTHPYVENQSTDRVLIRTRGNLAENYDKNAARNRDRRNASAWRLQTHWPHCVTVLGTDQGFFRIWRFLSWIITEKGFSTSASAIPGVNFDIVLVADLLKVKGLVGYTRRCGEILPLVFPEQGKKHIFWAKHPQPTLNDAGFKQQTWGCLWYTDRPIQTRRSLMDLTMGFKTLDEAHSTHERTHRYKSGWWLGHPSEKYESQLGWLEPQYMGK